MKPPNPDNPIRNTLKHLALGVAAAAAFFTSGPSANANVTYDFTTGVQGWTPVLFDTAGDPMWGNWGDWNWLAGDAGHLQNVWGAKDTGLLRSPEFLLNGTGDLTFQMLGTPGLLSTPVSNATPPVALRPSEIPATAYVGPANGQGGGFAGVGLRDVAADTYVLSKAHPGTVWIDHPVWTNLAFTAAELAPYMNNGKKYTLDFIDYDKSPDGEGAWLIMRNVSIPSKHTSSEITAFGTNVVGSSAVIDNTTATEGTVEWAVPFGTPLASLAPTFTLSSFATCNKTSGAIPSPNFSTGPLHYIVTAEDGVSMRDYTVTVTVDLPSSACEITAFGTNVAGSSAVITNDDTTGTVAWTLPPGTNLASLAPTFTLSGGATCNRTSGAVPTPDFSTGPLHYIVTAQDGTTTKDYTVTATVLPSLPVTTGLKLHLDASRLTGLSDNAPVNTWTDMSGLNNHATKTAGTPTYEIGELNGRPVVRFPVGGGATFSFPDMTDIRTVFWVVKEENATSLHFLLGHSDNYDFHRGDDGRALWSNSWASENIKNGTTSLNGLAVSGTSTALPTGWNLLSLGTTGNVTANRLTLDRVYGRSWEGDIAELLIYNSALSAADVKLVGSYLAAKYGLSTSYGPPVVVSSSPQDNGTVGNTSDLSLTFSEPIAIGTGNITIKNLTTPSQIVITLPDEQVTVSGAVLTINPTSDLAAEKNYAVQITAGAVKDLEDNPFAGISDDETWNFTTIASMPPPPMPPVTDGMVVWLPADGVDTNDSTQVRTDGGDTFVKQWKDLSGNNKHASNATLNDQPRYVASGDGKPVLRFGQDGNGDRLKFGDLSANFPTGASVFVVATVNNDGRYNLFGNRNNDERWVADTWQEARPGSFRGGRSQSATFTLSDWPTTGSHVFSLESDNTQFEVLINGASIGTDTANYHSGAGSDWTIGDSAADNDQRFNGDIAEVILYNRVLTLAEADQVGAYLATKYGLTTIYGPPTVVNYTPPDNSVMAASSDLVLTFNKPIAIGTGNVTIKNLTDMTQTVIDIADPQISILDAVLTINPTNNLVLNKNYAVQIDAGAIKALSDVPFAGIPDDTTWNFATAPPIATTTVVTSSGSPTTYGDSVTFIAKISPTPSGGTVQFLDGGSYLGNPVAVNTTTGEATYTTTMLSAAIGAATHEITAEYSGNFQFAGSSTATLISQKVDQAELTVKAVDVFRPRNTANPDPLPYQITGYKNDETLASSGVMGTPDLSTTAVLESPVGDYPITCTVIDLLAADNYSFKSVNGVLTVADVEDTFSVNFYYDGTDPVRIQSGVAAGLAGWYTPGWYNQSVPWGGGLQAPVTLSSNMASTSTFIFKDCRNGGGTQDPQRTTNLEDGTYSLMAAMAHGTSRITEEPNKVDIEMTNIPFGTYDVIFYMGRNPYHGGDGTGAIVFNDAPERAFTVKSGAFDGTFTEMVDGTTPGNYIVYPGVTGSSFTVQIYGNDFNHLGPTGFQIRKVPGPPYSTWAATNAPGQTPDQDYDNDGVENGIEYFMGETGSSFTAMPGLDATNKVSWTMDPDFEGTYEVQTSPDLGTWTNVVPKPMPSGGKLSYTLPTDEPGGKSFVRLLVTPTP